MILHFDLPRTNNDISNISSLKSFNYELVKFASVALWFT